MALLRGSSHNALSAIMEVVKISVVRRQPDFQEDPGGGLADGVGMHGLHLEALDAIRGIVGPVDELHGPDETIADVGRSEHIQFLDGDFHALLQQAPPNPQSHNLRKVHDLRKLFFCQSCGHRRVRCALDLDVEVAALGDGEISDDDVLELHGVGREAKQFANLLDQVRVPDLRRAAWELGQAPCPIPVASPTAAKEGEPHAIHGAPMNSIITRQRDHDSVPMLDHESDHHDHQAQGHDLGDGFDRVYHEEAHHASSSNTVGERRPAKNLEVGGARFWD
mmetsp:Transcript_80662/g.231642  ORF Transcript_80662/g.231642 Transcript_80662/m.231642 type:complete len:279 (-) Transcript_80662:33-869(-)